MIKKNMNKRAMSPVVVTILLIALVIVVVGIVWLVISNLVEGGMGEAESCFNVAGKVSLNPEYTCFEAGTNPNVTFSVKVGNIDVDEIIVAIAGEGGKIKSFTLNSTNQIIDDLVNYDSTVSERTLGTTAPGKNEGKTYVYNGTAFSSTPDKVEVAAIIEGSECGVLDTVEEIGNC